MQNALQHGKTVTVEQKPRVPIASMPTYSIKMEVSLQGKGLSGTFNSTTNKITMFAPINAAFSQNIFSVSSLVISEPICLHDLHAPDSMIQL